MNATPIITLLTDFGTRDGYGAAMKGVILDLVPHVTIVDAGHEIPPHDVAAAAWALAQYAFFFPKGTIHVAVVDPGVGSNRQGLIAQAGGHIFIAPDNGTLHWVSKSAAGFDAQVIRPNIHRPSGRSHTFDGRDVFANVAGRLASGYESIAQLSDPATELVVPEWGRVRSEGGAIVGEIIDIDHFGNAITSIHRHHVEQAGWRRALIQVGKTKLTHVNTTYSDVPASTPLALIGSHDHLEIAVCLGSAAKVLGLRRGDSVKVSEHA